MQSQFIDIDSPLWITCLNDHIHDFYHLPAYVRLCAEQDGGEPVAFVAEKDGNHFFVPLIVRPIESSEQAVCDLFDATTPYGYPCPLISTSDGREPKTDFLNQALRLLAVALKERRIISAFFRLHPILPLPQAPLQHYGCLVHHGHTVFIDLTLSQEELWRQTRAAHRNNINRAKRNHYITDMDRSPENLDCFIELYTETMHRVGAAEQYFFSKKYFTQLMESMRDNLHLCLVRVDGKVAAGGIFSETRGIIQYHLGGTKEEFLKHHGIKFMFDFIRTWAKQRGNRVFHLGGGFGAAEDSLFDFKAGFSQLRRPFHTWRLIADQDAYNDIVAQWERRTRTTADAPDGFFPAYRKPLTDNHGTLSTIPIPVLVDPSTMRQCPAA